MSFVGVANGVMGTHAEPYNLNTFCASSQNFLSGTVIYLVYGYIWPSVPPVVCNIGMVQRALHLVPGTGTSVLQTNANQVPEYCCSLREAH